MSFDPVDLHALAQEDNGNGNEAISKHGDILDASWSPMLRHACDFSPQIFEQVLLNLLRNPNINSSHLFRADLLYDSRADASADPAWPGEEGARRLTQEDVMELEALAGFEVKRVFIRKLVPRNVQLDRPMAQTCHVLKSNGDGDGDAETNLVVCIPHAAHADAIPWYHPTVQALAYVHVWSRLQNKGTISIHYRLFPDQTLPLPQRLRRTAHHLLSSLYKHGQGTLAGYTKKFHHDRLVSQQRVQDTYSLLKQRHAKRLCDSWVEQTEPSKHVFEDLSIAAFLIELWKDMYQPPQGAGVRSASTTAADGKLPPFPGFVDMGCGNGVLTEVLLMSGYPGWGFDARRRKTWSVLSPSTRRCLKEMVLIPQPVLDGQDPSPETRSVSLLARVRTVLFPAVASMVPRGMSWHNGIFPKGTFIISNHADELTAWTPLLASMSHSPFLAIPCCSHNLSGSRFRAPSAYNSHTADVLAPSFFATAKKNARAKSVAISIPTGFEGGDDDDEEEEEEEEEDEEGKGGASSPSTTQKGGKAAETGDLKRLRPAARAKQASAYGSLCDWVEQLSREAGYAPERETLRIPSTRNVGIVGRLRIDDGEGGGKEQPGERTREERVRAIARREGADGRLWIERAQALGVVARRGAGAAHD